MSTLFTRRSLIAGGALVAANFAVGGAAYALSGDETPLRPPGAQDETRFKAACIKCERCRSVCPRGCIKTATLEQGTLNWRTPVMDFHRGFCDFCGQCETVCPTGAIQNVSENSSHIGEAVVDTDRCIAWVQGGCRVCVDACPYKAITLDSSGRPVVDASACNGCGICENECPSNTFLSFAGGALRGINIVRKEDSHE